MRDRLPTPGKENRVKITMDDGSVVEGVLSYADDATQEGSAYTKGNVLPDEVCETFGIDKETSELKDVFAILSTPDASESILLVACKGAYGNSISGCLIQVEDSQSVTNKFGLAKFGLSQGTHSVSVRSPIDYGASLQTFSIHLSGTNIYTLDVTVSDEMSGIKTLDITSSMVVAFSERVSKADAFAVGGGGSGAAYITQYTNSSMSVTGGAGGKTATKENIDISILYSISIGAGGASKSAVDNQNVQGANGGNTTVKDSQGNSILTANGGNGGKANPTSAAGANGGSGSGGSYGGAMAGTHAVGYSGANGASGQTVDVATGGTGQGKNTRAFGAEDGELFSDAGASAVIGISNSLATGSCGEGGGSAVSSIGSSSIVYSAESGKTKGSGGGACVIRRSSSVTGVTAKSGAGASGLVRFRWEIAV